MQGQKIFSAEQVRKWDQYTIQHEPIPSIALMERACRAFTGWFIRRFPKRRGTIHLFCGRGNNGGDGLAIARLLHGRGYRVAVWDCQLGSGRSPDNQTNWDRLVRRPEIPRHAVVPEKPLPTILTPKDTVIDALFGSGLNRPVEGYWGALLTQISAHGGPKIAIDMPSGVFADQPSAGAAFAADYTITFESPKLGLLLPENGDLVGALTILPIGLHTAYVEHTPSTTYLTTAQSLQVTLRPRTVHSHKGTYGHALLIAGSRGMMGAAVLAVRSALRSGVGLVTTYLPKVGYPILQIAAPEAMALTDPHEDCLTEAPPADRYQAIGIGSGIGQRVQTQRTVREVLQRSGPSLIIDADALNIIARIPGGIDQLPAGAILTPHPGEYRRLFGNFSSDFERLEHQRRFSAERSVTVVHKGAFTCITTPDGATFFNPTGNPGMATGGSGDVLTGLLTGLVAQGYTAPEAAVLGVYLHGLAGDLAAGIVGQEALTASDIIHQLGPAFRALKAGKT